MSKKILWALALAALLPVTMLLGLRTPGHTEVCEGLKVDMREHGPPAAQQLAIALHGMRMEAEKLTPLANTILKAPGYEDTRVLVPTLPFSVLSTARAEDITACLLDIVDREWQAKKTTGQPYRSVLLVGHSMGSLFARKLYAVARGELESAPFENSLRGALGFSEESKVPVPPREWAGAVDRIVLLGAINRGWSVDHHMPLLRMAQMHAGLAFHRLVQAIGGPLFTVMATRKGAPFVTQLRLQWLEMTDCAEREPAARQTNTSAAAAAIVAPQAGATAASETLVDTTGNRCRGGYLGPVAPVAQLLGTQDDLIPPGDGIDPVTGIHFKYLEVPQSNHSEVVEMGGDTTVAKLRADVLLQALKPGAVPSSVTPELVAARGAPDFDVKHVVFVMHGIRDEGFWTERLAARVRTKLLEQPACKDNPSCKVKLEVSSYGYFPMLSFLKPGSRNEKVEWLMDRYAQARAQYPNAKFYYVGHSHGTYLLKEALDNYESVRFERVALAGSVLRTDQDWPALLKSGRVRGVLNLSASEDWVVALFPHALEQLGLQDLGGAGFYGFKKTDAPAFEQFPKLDKSWVVGGHGAAVAEPWWDQVARFIATGQRPTPDQTQLSDSQHWLVKAGGAIAPVIWLLIALVLALGMVLILRSRMREWAKTVSLIGYVWFFLFVLTSV